MTRPTAPYVAGSLTSEAAAYSIEDDLNRLEDIVFRRITAAGTHGMTDDELEVVTGLSHQTVSARRRTLVLKELLIDSGRQRPTRSGRKAVVWVRSDSPGALLGKAPPKPTPLEAVVAVKEIRSLYALPGAPSVSIAVVKLMKWVKYQYRAKVEGAT